jgi:hypothetical protein
MEAWRRRLASQRQDLLDDDEEEEMALRVLIDNLGMGNYEGLFWRRPSVSSSHFPASLSNAKVFIFEDHA